MAFEKGKSGNPGGRPKKSDEQLKFERRCREIADIYGSDRLLYWLKSSNPAASLAAIKEINERGFGKSIGFEFVDANVTSESAISIDDLARKIASLGGEGQDRGCIPPGSVGVEPRQ